MSADANDIKIEIRDLTLAYGAFVVMRDINVKIKRGEVLIIMGGSGCGKSTLLRQMIGLKPPAKGDIFYDGVPFWGSSDEDRQERVRTFGVAFQGGALWSSMTLTENIGLPLGEYTDLSAAEIAEIARFKLALVGLKGFEDYYPSEISGGMCKRAGLARALALDPEILFFDEPSVTGTEHILMAAVVSQGHTIIRNAACEPHVQDLANMLNAMGARISGIGTNQLNIDGVDSLTGTSHQVCHDHIEAASYLALAAATGGEIKVEGTDLHSYWMCKRVFATLGVKIELYKDHIHLPAAQEMRVLRDYDGSMPVIGDGPWPQFATDQMSCMITLATQVEGNVLFFEKMFESRLYFVDRLIAMGANAVVCDPHRVVISGKSRLRGTTMVSPDIRAGMALLGAALCATGKSTVQNANMIERGYERVEEKLLSLGARISRRA